MWSRLIILLDSPMLPLALLPFSCLIFITTATCIFDYAHWDMPLDQKLSLTTLYGPYAALCKSRMLSQSSFIFEKRGGWSKSWSGVYGSWYDPPPSRYHQSFFCSIIGSWWKEDTMNGWTELLIVSSPQKFRTTNAIPSRLYRPLQLFHTQHF